MTTRIRKDTICCPNSLSLPDSQPASGKRQAAPHKLKKFARMAFLFRHRMCTMRAPPRHLAGSSNEVHGMLTGPEDALRCAAHLGGNDGADRKEKISQSVDGRGICCMMCGSVGHFGGDQKGSGAEAVPDDL